MKKQLFLLLIVSILLVKVHAQAQQKIGKANDSIQKRTQQLNVKVSKHFTFRDVPIDGTIKQFVNALKKQNFKLEDITDVDAVLNGRFTGEQVQLLVQGKKETVGSVSVIFPLRDSWPETKERYSYIKANLIEKYGEPKILTENFEEPYSDGLGNEKQALQEGKCIYESNFTTETGEGMIRLKIHVDMSLMLIYIDTANYLKLRGEAKKEY